MPCFFCFMIIIIKYFFKKYHFIWVFCNIFSMSLRGFFTSSKYNLYYSISTVLIFFPTLSLGLPDQLVYHNLSQVLYLHFFGVLRTLLVQFFGMFARWDWFCLCVQSLLCCIQFHFASIPLLWSLRQFHQ